MNVHEYQAKQLLGSYGIEVPPGGVAATAAEAEAVSRSLGGRRWAVKAQIHAGARGPGGGVKLVDSVDDVREVAGLMLGSTLVTAQTGPDGQQVRRVYVEQGCDIARAFYLALLVDVTSAELTLLVSPERGNDSIEEIAVTNPELVLKQTVDLDAGPQPAELQRLAAELDLTDRQADDFAAVVTQLYRLFVDLDASLIELSPLVVTTEGRLLALDAKLSFDDSALFRHPTVKALRVRESNAPLELAAAQQGLNYVQLDGNIGLMVSGAGLALATLDALIEHGGRPANFLDVPPVSRQSQIAGAFRLLLSNPHLDVILVNVFGGGIMRCDLVAAGIIEAVKLTPLRVPLVIRLAGINAELGLKALEDAGINGVMNVTFCDDLNAAAHAAATRAARVKDASAAAGNAAASPSFLGRSLLRRWFGRRKG